MNNFSNGELFPVEVLRRPNQTIAILPKSGKITAVMRRLFISMLYFSQEDGKQDVYQRTLGQLMRKANYTSRNTADIKDQLRAMQGNQVEWNSQNDGETRWGVSGMIAQAEIIEQSGGPTIVEWALPPKIRDQLLDPTSYTSLILQIYTSLRSGAAIALYGICARYATNPSGVTMREDWEWWVPRITGNPEPEANNEYKYFKRDVIKPAIAEINTISDITVELVEHKDGKRIRQIQFKVDRKRNLLLDNEEKHLAPEVDGELLEQILRLGLKEKSARALFQEYDSTFLQKTVHLTQQRIADEKLPKLASPAAFFRSALKDRYADATPHVGAIKSTTAVRVESVDDKKERFAASHQAKRARDAFDLYKELSAEEQAAVRDRFAEATDVEQFRRQIRRRGLGGSPTVQAAFCAWYADELWGPVSESELMNHILSGTDAP